MKKKKIQPDENLLLEENIKLDAPILETVYGSARMVVDPETGETFLAKPIVGERFSKGYCIYGSLYKAYYSQLLKFEPMATLHVLNYLMMKSLINTNEVCVSNVQIQNDIKQSKSTVIRCLKVLRESNVLIRHKDINGDDDEEHDYINPLIWFRGTKDGRYRVFKALNNPPIWFKDEFYRKEFRIDEYEPNGETDETNWRNQNLV